MGLMWKVGSGLGFRVSGLGLGCGLPRFLVRGLKLRSFGLRVWVEDCLGVQGYG